MSGHSHWATIKHKKGAIDAKRGKLWSKLSRAIIAARWRRRPQHEPPLFYAIDKARSVSKDSIRTRHQTRHRHMEGVIFEEITYEGSSAASPSSSRSSPTTATAQIGGSAIFERGAAEWAQRRAATLRA